ncbi:MAG: hypothetical protein CR955_00450 [Thiotrichales bacterium]|nr:MAG: hypothetical protein CR955_00450 [Thiotrichales bacterium]
MSSSSGMSQLLKGIVIGVILILAIIGTMSLLDKSKPSDSPISGANSVVQNAPNIQAPSININPKKSDFTDHSNNNVNNQEGSEQLITDNVTSNDKVTTDKNIIESNNKPVLEGEKKPEKPVEIEYGMATVSAIHPETKERLNAGFVVLDKENAKIAETMNATTATYKLPVGEYKVTATLIPMDNQAGRPLPTVEKTKQLIITTDSKINQVFALQPPLSIGILQVSAVSSHAGNKAVRSNFIVQTDNGETVASRNNVTNSLFKLKAGSYKVTVRSGSISDFRTVVVEAGESTKEVFKLQEATAQGRVLIRVFDTHSSNPVNADIIISDTKGNIVQKLKSVTKTEISLAQGNYKIRVTGPKGQSNKNIRVIAGKSLSEIFRFDAPQIEINNAENSNTSITKEAPDTTDSPSENGTQITDNVTIKAVEPESSQTKTTTDSQTEQVAVESSNITILARNAADNRPIKSNIYIQTPAGKHLDKRTYVDSASFQLLPGVYRVTVRSKNRKNNIKTIRLSANQQLSETFLMEAPEKEVVLAPPKPAKSSSNNKIIPSGFLNVLMQPGNNQNRSTQNLNADFIVATKAGKKIVELSSVKSGNFKLDTGEYRVTAIYQNKRRTQTVVVRKNQNTRLIFKTSDFGVRQGFLRSRIINETGRPLKGNLSVKDERGRVVARANTVSTGSFELAPGRHIISVNYRGLRGSEAVRIVAGETTVQTFTIASNNPRPVNRNTLRRVRDEVKEEIQKQF